MIRLNRKNDYEINVEANVNSRIFISEDLKIESSALEQIDSFSYTNGIIDMSFSADIHKGPGVPVGTTVLMDTIYPAVTGNDIGCGMRFDILNIDKFKVNKKIKDNLRHAFFEGGREIFSPSKVNILTYGDLEGCYGKTLEVDVDETDSTFPSHRNAVDISDVLDNYKNLGSRDSFLGSVGGGNHFVEIQRIDKILMPTLAYYMGIKKGDYCVMTHSGSLDLGHQVGNHFRDLAKKSHEGKKLLNGFYALKEKDHEDYINASYNAANFAKCNRKIMAMMVAFELDTSLKNVYDSAHNLIWKTDNGFLHRKGSCPAYESEPVIIPGSMGTFSLIGVGKGNKNSIYSAPHGAGRTANRNKARNIKDGSLKDIEVVTKIDLENTRPDIYKDIMKHLMEESPSAYKDISLIQDVVEGSKIADIVAITKPILTIKG